MSSCVTLETGHGRSRRGCGAKSEGQGCGQGSKLEQPHSIKPPGFVLTSQYTLLNWPTVKA